MVPTSVIFLVVAASLATSTPQQLTPSKPFYLTYFCLTESGNYTQRSPYQLNLQTLLSSLQTISSSSSFSSTTTGNGADTVFGTYYCRRDLALSVCSACVEAAAKRIVADCPSNKEALVWYEQCTLLYLNSSSRLDAISDVSPYFMWWTPKNVSEPGRFYPALQATMKRVINESAYGSGFATAEEKLSAFETLYSLTQCSPNRGGLLCERCLTKALRRIDLCCNEYADMAFFYPSCQLRYSVLAPFYVVPNRPPPAITPLTDPAVASPEPPSVTQKMNPPMPGNWAIARSKNIFNHGVLMALITLILADWDMI